MLLNDALIKGSLDEVKKHIIKDPKLLNTHNLRGLAPLHLAILYNHPNILEYLINTGANRDLKVGPSSKDYKNYTPIALALEFKQSKMVIMLVNAEATVTIHYIYYALWLSDLNLFRTCLQNYNKLMIDEIPSSESNTLLCKAVLFKTAEIVQVLLDRGADFNVKTTHDHKVLNNKTLLFVSIYRKQKDIASLLIKAGAKFSTELDDIQSLDASKVPIALEVLHMSLISCTNNFLKDMDSKENENFLIKYQKEWEQCLSKCEGFDPQILMKQILFFPKPLKDILIKLSPLLVFNSINLNKINAPNIKDLLIKAEPFLLSPINPLNFFKPGAEITFIAALNRFIKQFPDESELNQPQINSLTTILNTYQGDNVVCKSIKMKIVAVIKEQSQLHCNFT